MSAIETYEHEGVEIKIYQDEDPPNPREDDQLAVLYCWHPDYKLGDEQFTRNDHDSMTDVIEFLSTERKAVVIVPLFLLDHSGITMSAGRALDLNAWSKADIEARDRFVGDAAGWDTTHVGFGYVTLERANELGVGEAAKKEGENLLDVFERQLRNEVAEYDQFLTGDVYGFVAGDGSDEDGSCWGLFGFDYAKSEAESCASWIAKERVEEAGRVAYWAARDVVTV